MAKARARLLTNFSKGELSPLIAGRPDLAAYYEGGRKVENWRIQRQGGLIRRPGTRLIAEVKDSTKDTILIPFSADVDSTFVLEFGDLYTRFIKNKQPVYDTSELILNGAFPTNLTNWTLTTVGGGTVVWDATAGGVMRLRAPLVGEDATARQSVATVAGTTYKVQFTITRVGGLGADVKIGSTAGGQEFHNLTLVDTGIYSYDVVATSALISIMFDSTPVLSDYYVDNVSIKAMGVLLEEVSPYSFDKLRALHFTQSVDVLYLFNPDLQQRKLNRLSDTNWNFTLFAATPPPSFEKDTDISAGATLTPAAVTGTGILFTASAAVFLAGDVGRLIIYGTSRAEITVVDPGLAIVTATILDDFPDLNPIASGSWLLRLSPQTTLDPDKSKPVKTTVTLVAALACFRAVDVGKFIVIYGGIIEIKFVDSTTTIRGTLLSEMTGTTLANPAAAAAGTWQLEVKSWSTTNGFPRTGEFYQGRLGQASTAAERTKFWLSQSDDFEGYAVGIKADQAIEYTMATRGLNRIEWIADNIDMFVGTRGTEHRIHGERDGQPLGGDVVPLVEKIDNDGCAPIQPITTGHRVIFVDRSLKKVFALAFNLEDDSFQAVEITAVSEHIMGTGVKTGPLGYAVVPDPVIYFVTEDGELVALTYFINEKVIGFSRFVTDGTFKAVAVISQSNGPDQVYVIVERTVSGVPHQYIEMFEEQAEEMAGRRWVSLQTDSAKLYQLNGVSTTVFTGLGHLEGVSAAIVADGSYRGRQTVVGGQLTLPEAATEHVEIGRHYVSTAVTMRPTVEGQMVEGLLRNWIKLWVRVKDTIGGTLNGERISYVPDALDTLALHTGDFDVTQQANPDTEGYITVIQDEPYPMKILAIFGEIEFSPHG